MSVMLISFESYYGVRDETTLYRYRDWIAVKEPHLDAKNYIVNTIVNSTGHLDKEVLEGAIMQLFSLVSEHYSQSLYGATLYLRIIVDNLQIRSGNFFLKRTFHDVMNGEPAFREQSWQNNDGKADIMDASGTIIACLFCITRRRHKSRTSPHAKR